VVVISVDEKSQIQALDWFQPVLPITPGMPERRTHTYVRNGLTTALHRRHRTVELKKFLGVCRRVAG
jgi:hypothetical protein